MSNKGKTYSRRLTDDEVREIRALHFHKGMSGHQVARLFQIRPVTANRVISRRGYANVPDLEPGTPEMCPCVQHTEARRRSVNLARARAAVVSAVCLHCTTGLTQKSVGELLKHGGAAVCRACEGRTKA